MLVRQFTGGICPFARIAKGIDHLNQKADSCLRVITLNGRLPFKRFGYHFHLEQAISTFPTLNVCGKFWVEYKKIMGLFEK